MAANTTPGTNVYGSEGNPGKYGAPPNNGNRAPINRDNAILTQDYTGRAQTPAAPASDLVSPLALSGATTAQLIVIPPNATQITMIGSAAFTFSEFGTAGAALTQYASWPANVPVSLDVGRMKNLFVAGTGNLSFFFQTL